MKKIMEQLFKKPKLIEDAKKDNSIEKAKKVKKGKIKERQVKMVLPKDEKLRKPKEPSNILIINPKRHHKASVKSKVLKVIIATFYEYADITKVNGMFYLRQFVTSGWLRLFWSCIMIGLLSFSTTLIYLLYGRYLNSPTRVTIGSEMPIGVIPFPGVTICHPQNIMEYKSKMFLKSA